MQSMSCSILVELLLEFEASSLHTGDEFLSQAGRSVDTTGELVIVAQNGDCSLGQGDTGDYSNQYDIRSDWKYENLHS